MGDVIRKVRLVFIFGVSDKEYTVTIEKTELAYASAFNVVCWYGKRGATQNKTVKNGYPLGIVEADKLFESIRDEKRNKGYRVDGSEYRINTGEIQHRGTPSPTSERVARLSTSIKKGDNKVGDILEQLRTFNENWDTGDLISLYAVGQLVQAEFKARKADLPEHVTDQLATLDSVIKAKLSAQKAKKIRDIKLRIDGLKTKDERKADYEKELAELTAS